MTADGEFGLFDLEDVLGTGNPGSGTTNPSTSLAGTPPGTRNPEMGNAYPGTSAPYSPGHEIPRTGLNIPQVNGAVPWAFDWAVGRGVTAVDPQGWKHHFPTLEGLIRAIPRGQMLVGEATFESYDVSQREHIIHLAASRGVILRTVPARGNTKRRAAAGLPEKTSQSKQTDLEDARAIQLAAVTGAHLKVPVLPDQGWIDLRARAARRLRDLRRSGEKEDYARRLMRHLPHFTHQPNERRIALGPTDGYNPVIVAAVGVAEEFVSDRAGFERLTGLYSHGYPSQFRSDLMHWGWGRQARKRELITLSVYRRELRWLFHQFKTG